MRVLMTGGSGDLGTLLGLALAARGATPVNLDLRPPQVEIEQGVYVQGSITERSTLARAMQDVDVLVHIAALHGIHEARQEADIYGFWDINVTGTFYVFEAAARAGIRNIVHISSTSIDKPYGIYGHTKLLGEEVARAYYHRHQMRVITLRPRAFIPHWNRYAYNNFVEWAQWFWDGAVHIDDVVQATLQSIDLLQTNAPNEFLTLTVDGAYDYRAEDLANWDAKGVGMTFRKYYPKYVRLVHQHGLDPSRKPTPKDISATQAWLGYEPRYSLRNLLKELATYGAAGPPRPF